MITEDGKVEFNEAEQAVIDKAMGDRLSRESIHDKNEIIEILKDFGYEGTPAEIKAAVKIQADEFKRQQAEAIEEQRLESLKEQAKEEGTTPQLLAKIEKLEQKLSEIDGERTAIKQTEQQRQSAKVLIDEQIKHFAESEDTKDIDLAKLNENPKFVKFLKSYQKTGKVDDLVEAYKDFVDLVGDAEAKAIAKIQANADRSTSSGKSKGDPAGGTYGLTAKQQELADENGMTYKEYSDGLKLVKK